MQAGRGSGAGPAAGGGAAGGCSCARGIVCTFHCRSVGMPHSRPALYPCHLPLAMPQGQTGVGGLDGARHIGGDAVEFASVVDPPETVTALAWLAAPGGEPAGGRRGGGYAGGRGSVAGLC